MPEETQNEQTPTQAAPAQDAKDVKGIVDQLEAFFDEHMVKKAPFQIPQGGKEFIAKVSPYLIILFAIATLPLILFALGLGAILAPFAILGGWHMGGLGMLSALLAIVTLVVELSAVPGLFKRTRQSWRLVFYASLISLAANVLSLNIFGGIIGAIIGWYILFQVKEVYKN